MAAKSRVAFADCRRRGVPQGEGRKSADFDAAITSTFCDMWPDTQAIRSRRTKH